LIYDEGGASKHVAGKNFCNIGGYVTFEIGATKIIGSFSENTAFDRLIYGTW
jgi:hypothetical protein